MCPHWSRKGRRSAQYTTTYSASTAIGPYGRENFSSSLDFNVKVEIEVQIAKNAKRKNSIIMILLW